MANSRHILLSDGMASKSQLRVIFAFLLLLAYSAPAISDDRVAQGKALATDRSKGNCLACHMIEDGVQPGNIGPPLLAMKLRFPDRDTLTSQVCDATLRNSNSRMPPFCRHRILSVEEVELIIDYLYTL
jgi:sulfur-oxidizing protein SoxX